MFIKYYKIIDLSLLAVVAVFLILMVANLVPKSLFEILLFISIFLFIVKIILRIVVKKSLKIQNEKETSVRKNSQV